MSSPRSPRSDSAGRSNGRPSRRRNPASGWDTPTTDGFSAPVDPFGTPSEPLPDPRAFFLGQPEPVEEAVPDDQDQRYYSLTKYRGIARVEDKERGLVGFWVRTTWKKKVHARFFADSKHGDRLGALGAAVAWRDQTEQQIGKTDKRGNVRHVVGRTTNTGFPGIREITKGGGPVFEATVFVNRERFRTSFSIRKYGRGKALRMARAWYKAKQRGEPSPTEEE